MPGANPEGKDQRRPAVFAADEIYTKNQEEMQCQYIYIYGLSCLNVAADLLGLEF